MAQDVAHRVPRAGRPVHELHVGDPLGKPRHDPHLRPEVENRVGHGLLLRGRAGMCFLGGGPMPHPELIAPSCALYGACPIPASGP
ncbi:hypothetical protein ACR6C2_11555 [Streptomyces sp. INA 01156]